MCSYVSPESLMPPLELISCAAIARERCGTEVQLIDAIAEGLNEDEVITRIEAYKPDIITSLTGFECYEEDILALKKITSRITQTDFILFGHYATHFPAETLIHSGADYIILGEPELVFESLLSALIAKNEKALETVEGIAYLQGGELIKRGKPTRINDPNDLPIPAYDLLPKGDKYYEPLLPVPYGMIQTVRGCPYACNYCVKSYGTKLSQLTTERVIAEIKIMKELHGIKSLRFIDDTFTINKRRVIELCKAIIEEKLDIKWVCLSRADNLDDELLTWMKKAGCHRIYFGMESGSQRMLDIYKKNVKVTEALTVFHLCKKHNIETAVFFMIGHPDETEKDFEDTLKFAREAKLSYVSIAPLTPYPGTPLFDELSATINFNIFPYKNEWKNTTMVTAFKERKQRFYKGFYLRPGYLLSSSRIIANNFWEVAYMGFGLLRYIILKKPFLSAELKDPEPQLKRTPMPETV